MPYIKQEDREKFYREHNLTYMAELCETPGELNYAITSILHEYIYSHGKSYATFNEMIGVLECAKMELYRRKIAPYENEKIKENGDV